MLGSVPQNKKVSLLASDISLKILHPSGHPRGLPDSGCLPGGPTRGARGRHSGRRGAYVTSFL